MVDCYSQHHDEYAKYVEDIYLSLWGNSGRPNLPDPINDAFRKAVITTAIEICHECGTHDASVKFCAEAIAEWMKDDVPK